MLSCALALGCSSHSDSPSGSSPEASTDVDAGAKDAALTVDAAAGTAVEHGTLVDYETLKPVQGLTVSDNGVSTTTDATGAWSLVVPAGASLQPTVTGSTYSRLLFPDTTAVAADIDFARVVVPDATTYGFEEMALLTMDTSKALVQVVAVALPSCASAVGGTLAVTSPAGASVQYFATSATPESTLTSFQDVEPDRPVAVVFNIDPSATLSVQVTHPTCKQAAYPVTYAGREYPGTVRLSPAEPGHVNAALLVFLE